MHEKSHHQVHLFPFLFLLIFSDLLRTVEPEIQTLQISSDHRAFILLHDFGFRDPGHISLSASSLSIASTTSTATTPTKLSFMGFYYGPTPVRQTIQLTVLEDTCLMGNPFVFPIFTLDKTDLNRTVLVTIPDLYYIFFLNCAKNTSVSMTVNLQTYNLDPRTGKPDYIDDHFNNLPTTLFIFSMFFFVFLLWWTYACYKNKHFLHRVHVLMGLLLLLKYFELISHANAQYSIRQTGTSHVWNVLWLAFYSARNGLFVAVIMLIRAGGSIFRPGICGAIFLQLIASACFVMIHLDGPSSRNYRYWAVAHYAADFLCCVVMVVPVSNLVDQQLAGNYSKGKRVLMRKVVFGNFVWAVYVYVGLTRVGVFVVRALASHDYWLFSIVLESTVEVVFYVVVYFMFWPSERYDYVAQEIREEELLA